MSVPGWWSLNGGARVKFPKWRCQGCGPCAAKLFVRPVNTGGKEQTNHCPSCQIIVLVSFQIGLFALCLCFIVYQKRSVVLQKINKLQCSVILISRGHAPNHCWNFMNQGSMCAIYINHIMILRQIASVTALVQLLS